ncbi:rta1 domain protein [Colletotrichum plurivorum]|uniref:Rta1 domain protein n=1 Tax=Colletotrichum plurivorum TaxID=2175906 RepID=A0A8H6J8K0_9PEZI|nr:rta1 domain protein [Colletotrichum plurivorum]
MSADDHFHIGRDAEFGAFWPFHPSSEVNLCVAIFFGLTTLMHTIQAFVYKQAFCWVVVMGCAWESVAFVLRFLGSMNGNIPAYYIASSILFNLAPLWVNAFVYMVGVRLIWLGQPEQTVWCIAGKKLAKVFVALDIICFLAQGGGTSLMSQASGSADDSKIKLGQGIYIFGCVAQLCFMAIFAVLLLTLRRNGKRSGQGWGHTRPILLLELVIYIVMILISIRVIFRLIEFGGGVSHDNPLTSNELYAVGFDAVPMIVALYLLNFVPPGRVLRGLETGWSGKILGDHELLVNDTHSRSLSSTLHPAWRPNME